MCVIVSGCSTCEARLCPVVVPFVLMKCDSRLSFLRTCIHLLSSTRTHAAPIRVRQADCIKLKSSMDQVTCASVCVFVSLCVLFLPFLLSCVVRLNLIFFGLLNSFPRLNSFNSQCVFGFVVCVCDCVCVVFDLSYSYKRS